MINWVMNGHPVQGDRDGRPRRPARSGDPNEFGQIWDHFAVEYEYKNGARMFSYCRHIPASNGRFRDGRRRRRAQCNGQCATTSTAKQVANDDIDAYVQEHIDLLNSIRAGKPLNELKHVAESTFTAILGRNAAYAATTLKWDDALAANEDTMPKNLTLDGALPVTRPRRPVPGSCPRSVFKKRLTRRSNELAFASNRGAISLFRQRINLRLPARLCSGQTPQAPR